MKIAVYGWATLVYTVAGVAWGSMGLGWAALGCGCMFVASVAEAVKP